MGRPALGAAKRGQPVTVRFTKAEAEILDEARGDRDRSEYVRALVLRDAKNQRKGGDHG